MKIIKILTVIMILTIISVFFLSGEASGEPRVLKAVTHLKENDKFRTLCVAYAKDVERFSDGQLIIDIIGGKETIGSDQQIFSLRDGVIDINFDLERVGQFTPVYVSMVLTNMKPWEEREAGLYDMWRKIYAEEANVYWLGPSTQIQWFCIALNKEAKNLDDLAGLKIRTMAANAPAIEALGAVPIVMPFSDIYQAMERGVIDGFLMTTEDWVKNSWQEVTKYMLNIRFLNGPQTGILVNMDVWESLSEQEKNWLQAPLIENEKNYYALAYWNYAGGEYAVMEAGVEFINWSNEEREKAIQLARLGIWNAIKEDIYQKHPEYVEYFVKVVKGLSYP